MSAQGATLGRGTVGRGTVRLPMWPVAALVAAAAAVTIGITMIDGASRSGTAIREQGEVPAVVVGISHVTPSLHSVPSVPSVGYAGFENPGAYITEAPAFAPGLGNPGYPAEAGAPAVSGIMVNGEPCMQCR